MTETGSRHNLAGMGFSLKISLSRRIGYVLILGAATLICVLLAYAGRDNGFSLIFYCASAVLALSAFYIIFIPTTYLAVNDKGIEIKHIPLFTHVPKGGVFIPWEKITGVFHLRHNLAFSYFGGYHYPLIIETTTDEPKQGPIDLESVKDGFTASTIREEQGRTWRLVPCYTFGHSTEEVAKRINAIRSKI